MPDATPAVIDGQPEPTLDDLLTRIIERRVRWETLVGLAGDGVEEPGAAGVWTLRDVVAHINAYLRFHVASLGGQARPFRDMPADVGLDVEKRNQWMHREDMDLPWAAVQQEGHELHEELVTQLRARSPEDMQSQMVPWHHWPTWRWMCDIRNHYDEHAPQVAAWLDSKETA